MSRSKLDDTNTASESPDPSIVIVPKISDPWTVDKALVATFMDKLTEGSESPIPYFHLLERLKTTPRKGWRRFGIHRGDSIANHIYRMSMISILPPPSLAPHLDLHRCMKMCLIHDMAESLVGDLTPSDRVPKAEKNRREATAIDYITQKLLGNVYDTASISEDIREIWQEHEDSKTLESHYVQDIDKLDLLLQMVKYEKRGDGKIDLSKFAYVETKLRLSEMKSLARDILTER